MMEDNLFLQIEGNANDLLMVNNDNSMKCTRLIQLEPDIKPEEDEILDICITSTNVYGEHPRFDELLGKKIRITVEIID